MENNRYTDTVKECVTSKASPKGRLEGLELRSEKVRNIIGKIPSALVRYGTVIIGLALLSLLVISAFIPYRETVPVKISVVESESGLYGKAIVAKDKLTKIHLGNNVAINDPQLGYLQAKVSRVSSQPFPGDGFMREVEVSFPPSVSDKIQNGDVMEGRIILSDIPVLTKFLQSLGIRFG
ncbi:MAG: hypothetical protein PHO94_05985 [Petrimonas sp.]|nr:hypothetical protein [Petrimonas sp.]